MYDELLEGLELGGKDMVPALLNGNDALLDGINVVVFALFDNGTIEGLRLIL